MPLNPRQKSLITELLNEDNLSEIIEAVILNYSTDVNRTSHLISLIPKIAEKQLEIVNKNVIDYSFATNLLIGECVSHKKSKMDFATMLHVARVNFPNGNCEGVSPAGKEFFDKFVDMIKNKDGFDYTLVDDWKWVRDIVQCESWMLSVIEQNVELKMEDEKNEINIPIMSRM